MVEDFSIQNVLRSAISELATKNNPCARRDAELLLACVLGVEASRLMLLSGPVPELQQQSFNTLIERRMLGEPVAYITGEQAFWSLDFYVDQHTLIPRPDTETLVEVALKGLSTDCKATIWDIGTGSGCILLSILAERPMANGVGLDVSIDALVVAQKNAQRHGLSQRAKFLESDLFDALASDKQADLIISNPPYIPTADIQGLMFDVREFEPVSALDGGFDGLEFYRKIARHGYSKLKRGGVLAVEIGVGQADDVGNLFTSAGFSEIQCQTDLAGKIRVVSGKKTT
jgi:release factor glutamine methyltransferase